MTQTKLQIIGPYTPEHEGPFCTRDGRSVRILCSDMLNNYSIVAIVSEKNGKETASTFLSDGRFSAEDEDPERDLMNAREVPVAREFWVNEYEGTKNNTTWFNVFLDQSTAKRHKADAFIRTIHVREVLPGEDE